MKNGRGVVAGKKAIIVSAIRQHWFTRDIIKS